MMQFVLVVVLLGIAQTFSSLGDMDPNYRGCYRNCLATNEAPASPLLQFMQWDLRSECKYQCMRNITEYREQNGWPIYKYDGHWPFVRVLGMQEPASVLFSLGNILPHLYYLFRRHQFTSPLRKWISLYCIVAINAWIWSCIYHARKLDFTILGDLCSAFALLACSLFVFMMKLSWDYSYRCDIALFSLLVAAVAQHVYNMINFRYTFNDHMTICIALGVIHATLWLLWCMLSRSKHRLLCFVSQMWFIAASMLELFDFPPICVYFDAHSLWHAATIPLGFLWYEFLRRETNATGNICKKS